MSGQITRTRKLIFTEKVIRAQDLRRMADIFAHEATTAQRSGDHFSVVYAITFSDNTALEGPSPELFSEESLATPGRAVVVRMTFISYSLSRRIDLSLAHGSARFNNGATVSGDDSAWVDHTFSLVKEAADKIQPQDVWPRKHPVAFLIALALGIGCIMQILADAIITWLFAGVKPIQFNQQWEAVLARLRNQPLDFVFRWCWRFIIGLTGVVPVAEWFLRIWPNIEFDFGLDHLRVEKIQRRRLLAVSTLVVLPVIISLIMDHLRK